MLKKKEANWREKERRSLSILRYGSVSRTMNRKPEKKKKPTEASPVFVRSKQRAKSQQPRLNVRNGKHAQVLPWRGGKEFNSKRKIQ